MKTQINLSRMRGKKYAYFKRPEFIASILMIAWAFALSTYAFTSPPAGCSPGSCANPLTVDFENQTVSVASAPTASGNVATKAYVDSAVGATGDAFMIDGSTMPTMLSAISASAMNQGGAGAYCAGLTENGYADWRLPTMKELEYLVYGGAGPAITDNQSLWTQTRADYLITGSAGNNRWLYLIPYSGQWSWDSASNFYARCVR